MKAAVRTISKRVSSALPPGTAGFVYRTLLKPAPLRYLANRLILSILPHTVALPEGTVVLNPEDPVVSGALALGVYETSELDIFRAFLKEGMTVLDIGANIGIYTVIAARRVGPTGTVIACEPEQTNFSLLSDTIHENKFTNVRAFPCALADHQGNMELHISSANKGNHSLVKTDRNSAEFTRAVSVPVQTTDALLAEAGVANVDIIKMDIEGAEPLALKGMTRTLEAEKLILFFEFSPGALKSCGFDPHAVLSDLRNSGFTLYEIKETQKKILPIMDMSSFVAQFSDTQYTNLLCVKGSHVQNIIRELAA